MLKVAILDDYQNAFQQIVEVEKYKDKFDFKVFNEPFADEKEAIVALEDFEVLFIMRERTPMTKYLIESLPKLKYIMTSGMRNKSIELFLIPDVIMYFNFGKFSIKVFVIGVLSLMINKA